jgi:hypothetical protein
MREAMWELYRQYYSGSSAEKFAKDLDDKQHVILLRDLNDGSLQGFSTLRCYETAIEGRKIAVVYSGDTLVSPRYWGQTALQRAFLKYIVYAKLLHPHIPVYWFLISKGYKTYLLLSRNFPVYWPRHEQPTPSWERAVLDQLCRAKFGERWQPERGILLPEGERLRRHVAPIDEDVLQGGEDIRFFVQQNPRHAEGEELCCLGLVTPAMWAFYLRRLSLKRVRWVRSLFRRRAGRGGLEVSWIRRS